MTNIWLFIRTHTYMILLYVISAVIVCFLFPRGGKFPFEFQKGKLWGHDDLSLPFDVPILKTQREVESEKDSLLRTFVMYYNEDSDVAEQQKKRFSQSFNEQWANSTLPDVEKDRLHRAITDLLNQVYGQGILQADEGVADPNSVQNHSDRAVILKNKIADEYDRSRILSPKTAYELVISRLEKTENHKEMIFIRRLNLDNFIQPNLTFNADITRQAQAEQISKLSLTRGVVPANRRIIAHGDQVNDEKFNILVSAQREYENRVGVSGNFRYIWIGQTIIIIICFLTVYFFLMFFRPEIFRNTLRTAFLLLIMLLFIALSCIVVRNEYFSLYILPYVLIPVIICTFFDARTASFIYIITLLLVGFIAPNGFELFFLNAIAGFTGIVHVKSIYRRGSLFRSVAMVILAYSLTYAAIALMQGTGFRQVVWINFLYFAISGALVFVAYPSIFIFEKIFGFISDITLMELSDTNQPLLRKLSEVAPGTFQHSLQVANLAEEVIQKIGGKPLLIRTGALYHDIGKINRPDYFIENQAGGHNPHETLSPINSAQIIIEHVTMGMDIARKNRIPQHVIDFIRTHHGTTTVRYFYHLHQKQHPENHHADRTRFTYPGPIPFTREMVVLMMCDSIEAASRSLKEITHANISDMVDNIVNYQILEDQYNDANITYREINTAKQIIKNRLMNIYHVRIEYPKS